MVGGKDEAGAGDVGTAGGQANQKLSGKITPSRAITPLLVSHTPQASPTLSGKITINRAGTPLPVCQMSALTVMLAMITLDRTRLGCQKMTNAGFVCNLDILDATVPTALDALTTHDPFWAIVGTFANPTQKAQTAHLKR